MEHSRDLPSPFLWSSPPTIRGVFCAGSTLHIGYFTWTFVVWASLWHKTKMGKDAVTFLKHCEHSSTRQYNKYILPQWFLSKVHKPWWRNWGLKTVSFALENRANPHKPWVPLVDWIGPNTQLHTDVLELMPELMLPLELHNFLSSEHWLTSQKRKQAILFLSRLS